MSEQQFQDLSARVDLLSDQVAELTQAVRQLTLVNSAPTGSYQLVSSPAPSSAPAAYSAAGASFSSTNDLYNSLAEEIPKVPDFVVRSCSLLSGSSLSFGERAARAWECGWWARFVLEGKLTKVRPSKPINLANTIYVVLKAEGYSCPLLATKASDYRAIVKDFKQSTLSHGFPSQAEAKAYCLGAGVSYPDQIYRWS